MQTVTINILNKKAIRLLKHLEALNLIKVVKKDSAIKSAPIASKLKGSLTTKQADAIEQELNQMRDEWHRNI